MKNSKKTNVKSIGVIFTNILIFIGACLIMKSLNKDSLAIYNEVEKNMDVNTIIENNLQKNKKEELIQKEEEIEYKIIYEENSDLPKGTEKVIREGINGKKIITIKKTYEGERLISEEECSSEVTKEAIDKIIQVGK